MPKLLRITTVPLSLHKLLEGQFTFMQKNGFDVYLASGPGKETTQVEKNTGIKVHTLPLNRQINPIKDLKALWATYRLIKQLKPDIVHTHTPKAGLIGMMAARLAGVKIRMHTVAGLPVMEARGIKKMILMLTERITSYSATGIYPNSFALKDYMLKARLSKNAKTKVLAQGSSNGINLSHFDPKCYKPAAKERLRTSLGIDKEAFVFSFVGRLVGDKGINELVSSFMKVAEFFFGNFDTSDFGKRSITEKKYRSHRHPKLLLIGPEEAHLDPLQAETRNAITQNPNIITTGWQEDIRPYLAITDVFVFPSYREGMPNVVLQAGAMGLPQIVTDINGSNEIIKDGFNGLIVPPKDAQRLHEAMLKLLQDESLRKKLSQNARDSIKKRFDQKVVWDALLKEYLLNLEFSQR